MSEIAQQNDTKSEILLQYSDLNNDEKKLIDETIEQIGTILRDATLSIHEQVGELILSKFFDGNPEIAGEIDNINSTSQKSVVFRALAMEVESRSGCSNFPKKTWLYNAVNIVCDNKNLERFTGHKDYKKLSPSKKIELLSITDPHEKLELAKKIVDEKMTVRSIRQYKGVTVNDIKMGLTSYIMEPNKIKDVSKIKLAVGKRKEKAIELAESRIKILESEINTKGKDLDKLKELLKLVKGYVPKLKKQN